MPAITALLHTCDDARRLGRALETLRCCNQIVVVDHGSEDHTLHIAREYGARIVMDTPDLVLHPFLTDWVLSIQAAESISEGLEATLLDWRVAQGVSPQPFSLMIREETAAGWQTLPKPQPRLLPRTLFDASGYVTIEVVNATPLEGELLRFWFP